MSGIAGSLRPPVAATETSARELPLRRIQAPACALLLPRGRANPTVTADVLAHSIALRTLVQVGPQLGLLGYVRVQLGLGANENEYRCEGMSHWQPG